MSTAVIWSKSKPDVEFQHGGRLGEFHGMSSQSHVSHCRVLPLGEFTVVISEPHATLQGVIIPSAILKIVFHHIFLFFKCSLSFDERRLSYRLVTHLFKNWFDDSVPINTDVGFGGLNPQKHKHGARPPKIKSRRAIGRLQTLKQIHRQT